MSSIAAQILHGILILALAPLLTGYIRWLKARMTSRRGAPIWQPYRDIARLLRKEACVADAASWIFRAAPYVGFAAIFVACLMVPMIATDLPAHRMGDLLIVLSLLAMARFWTALAGLDIGTAFGGLGASRDLMIASLAEPALCVLILVCSLITGSTMPGHIAEHMIAGGLHVQISLLFLFLSLSMVAVAENGRVPIDNPATHLELTMVHEAMVLEYSGRHLALIEVTRMMKLVLYIGLIGALFFPYGMVSGPIADPLAVLNAVGAWIIKLLLAGFAVAMLESSIAKMRVFRVPEYLGAAILFALLAGCFVFLFNHGGVS
ncbi:MAG: NADH-quinone oxidoreductase subunit H [Alphaproteobacteria bacterium]|nr:MAG: NADH-quinone oxidoreductase subunit H [Alphaproteobacteria bacterium]